jgi:hypothetical protein
MRRFVQRRQPCTASRCRSMAANTGSSAPAGREPSAAAGTFASICRRDIVVAFMLSPCTRARAMVAGFKGIVSRIPDVRAARIDVGGGVKFLSSPTELNRRGIATAKGGRWQAVQGQRLLVRLV